MEGSFPQEIYRSSTSERATRAYSAFAIRLTRSRTQRMIVAPARSTFPPPSHNALPLGQDESGWRSFVYGRRIKTVVPPSRATVVSLDRAPKTADEDGDDATMTTSLEDAKAAALASLDLDSPDTPAVAPTSSVSSSTAEALDPDHPAHQPTPALLLTIPAPHLTRILGHFDDWLQERVEAHELALAYTPSTIFAPTSVRRKAASSRIPTAPVAAPAKPSPPPPAPRPPLPTLHESHWILSILSRVDSLLMGDDISTLRQLAKTLTSLAEDSDKAQRDREKIRGGTAGRSMEEKLLDEEEAEGRAHCWMIVAAISSVWAQSDLWQQ